MKKRYQGFNFFTYLTFTVFVGVLLLSQVKTVQAGRNFVIGAQQQGETLQSGARAEAERVFDEAIKLYRQGTAKFLRQAIEKLEEALKLYQDIGDKGWQATTLNNIGLVYYDLGDKQQALKFYKQALPLWIEVGYKSGQATTLNNIGRVYNDLGDKQQALIFYNQALPLRIEVGDKSGQADTLNNIGRVYSNLGDKQQALIFYNQALPLWIEVGDKSGQATTLSNIGLVYSNLGDKQQALIFYNQALPLWIEVGDKSGQATTLSNIGLVHNDLGHKQQALKFYNQALPLSIEVGDKLGQATTLNNIGLVYSNLGDKQQALIFYNQALPLWIEVGDKSGQATTLSNIGSNLGDKQQALIFYNRALPLSIEVGDKSGQANTLNNIGAVYDDALGDKQQALKFYNQALSLSIEVGDKLGQATTLNNIGAVYDDALGDKQQALKFYNQALPLSIEVGDKSGQAATLCNIAYLERGRGNLEESLKYIQTAIEIIENLRKVYTNKHLQSAYFASIQDYYQFYIDLLMQLHKKNPSKGYDALALHISERSRARGLIELLAEANANIRKGVDPKLLASEQLLLGKINAIPKQIQELNSVKGNNKDRIAALEQERDNILNQYRELQTEIRITSPEYFAIKYPQPLELKQIQQQLDKDTVLLQYSLGKDHSYLWAVTPDSMNVYELPASKAIEEVAKSFHGILAQENAGDLAISTSEKLSKIILAPVADKLGKQRLVIVADGVLQSIPFAALADPTNKSEDTYQPLIVNHEITNLPSVTALATQRKLLNNRKMASKTLAVLADPVFEADDKRITGVEPPVTPDLNLNSRSLQRALKNLKRNKIKRLENTRAEAEAILKLVSPSETIHAYGFDANYNFVNSPELKQYRFLLFATHGFVDTTNPELSGIVLAQFDKSGKQVSKGYLLLGDIFNLDLGAELVVLSACETGLGKDIKGEGFMGLTRGLMYAGSKRAVVSLWKVDDPGTSQLMPKFYSSVLQGKSPVTALRDAQLQLLQDKTLQSAYYWAAFTLQGDWR